MSQAQQEPQKPVKTIRGGRGLKVSIWRNKREVDGRTVDKYSVKLEKSYRDENEHWRTSDYLFEDDLPRASKLLDTAFAWIILKEENGGDGTTDFPPPAE